MTTQPLRQPIVVGVDGSDSALRATQWAAAEALRRKLPLRIVHVCVLPPIRHPATIADQGLWIDALADNGQHILAEAAATARAVAPTVELVTDQRMGFAAEALIEESARAHALVLGSRGLGGFQRLLVGSVAIALSAHGHCPVIVVRGAFPGQATPGTGPVVVGVDGSPASEAAIRFAFDEASVRRTSLVAVHTWLDIAFTGAWTALPTTIDWDAVEVDETMLLDERLAGWQEKYPDVAVERVVLRDRPVRALLDKAEGAQLIVVGTRGHGALLGMGLGSTSQALLHHAECPVAVVRPDPEGTKP
ncbi:universal stress protein [Actinokineospora xionganensis]|uniref:Universal stress protein n=1 Tax=Actinokineospora xionganensis TaxID=2684470 RepID=A0ABR7KZF9_9PSEU|nr:universal stress protein [Actinokineospora xionganensis]MBC6445816.1 universal stress protein [Actinokineospora xionganensis]